MQSSSSQPCTYRTWSKDQFIISTDPRWLSIPKINAAFASDDVYWAQSMPEADLRDCFQRSLSFGLYDRSSVEDGDRPEGYANEDELSCTSLGELVGIARCVTDHTTVAYLTDVYIWPTHQGRGLGKWLIACVQEVLLSMPYLRRSMLLTSDWERSVPFYQKMMGMELMGHKTRQAAEGGPAIMQWKGPMFPEGV
jgi:GNAT superfamily N-acetyltransferase